MAVVGGIVFLHGSGDSGNGFRDWLTHTDSSFLDILSENGYIFRFPSATLRPYSLNGGHHLHVWHDRTELTLASEEDTQGIDACIKTVVDSCIDTLVRDGAPVSRIYIIGMSMGGHVALQSLLYSKYSNDIAGVVGLSCFISSLSPFWKDMATQQSRGRRIPPLLMMHGTDDWMVSSDWGIATSSRMRDELNAQITFEAIENLAHDMCSSELQKILSWMDISLP